MSDPESKPAEPATPTPSAPLAPPPPRPAPIGDYDDSMLSHLGLPFYYRHTPTRALGRTAFWLAFISIILVLCGNLLGMPYARDTIIYRIRESLFDNFRIYTSFADAGHAVFSQFFVFAIIFSGIIAPLFATFSLSSERLQGTMEFLRLSPMSTLSIVLGKMFAPVYSLHIFSATLLLIGSVAGLLAGLPLNDVCFAATIIVLHAALMHALGAFLAIFTLAFRGFGAVFFLLLFGYILSAAPVVFNNTAGVTFFVYASPWGAMEHMFWQGPRYYSWIQNYTPLFAGYESAITPYIIGMYGITFVMLVWAASRKLDRSDRNALPYAAWMIIWAAVLLTAFGSVPNFAAMPIQFKPNGWQCAAVIILIGSLITCGLALLDHPHSRENILADECERASGRETTEKKQWRLTHAFFVTGLVLVTACIMLGILYHILMNAPISPDTDIDDKWRICLAAIATAVSLTFSFALLVETVAVGYDSLPARAAMVAAGIAIFLFAVFGPIVNFNIGFEHWNRSMTLSQEYFNETEAAAAQVDVAEKLARASQRLQYLRSIPEYAPYLEDIHSAEDVLAHETAYRDPARFVWHYHRSAFFVYLSIYLGLITALILWRRRNYAMLRREAHQALGVPEHGPAPAGETPELAQAV